MILFFLEMVLITMLTACAINPKHCNNYCQINNDHLEYLDDNPNLRLYNAMDLKGLSFMPSDDYGIPKIDVMNSDQLKVGKQLNICPPSLLQDISE